MRQKRASLLLIAAWAASVAWMGCGSTAEPGGVDPLRDNTFYTLPADGTYEVNCYYIVVETSRVVIFLDEGADGIFVSYAVGVAYFLKHPVSALGVAPTVEVSGDYVILTYDSQLDPTC